MRTNDKRRKDKSEIEMLNRFSNELLRAFEAGETEISMAAASPFLYRRIRVRIEAEEQRLAQQRSVWLSLLYGVKHAIPVMAALAVFAVASLILTPLPHSQQRPTPNIENDDFYSFSQDDLFASAAGVETGLQRTAGETK